MRAIKRGLSLFLILSLMLSLFLYLPASASSTPTGTAEEFEVISAEEFQKLPDNTIVCYMFGQPVYKFEVDSNYIVHKDFSANAVYDTRSGNYTSYYSESSIPYAHRGEAIYAEGHLTAPRFSQNDSFSYIPCADAVRVAQELEGVASEQGYLSVLLSLIAPAGTFVSGIVALSGLGKAQLAAQIRRCTDNGADVILVSSTSTYGSFRAAHEWDGLNCIRYSALDPVTGSTAYVDRVIGACGETIW